MTEDEKLEVKSYEEWVLEVNSIADPVEKRRFQMAFAVEIQQAATADRNSAEAKAIRKKRVEEQERTKIQRVAAEEIAEERKQRKVMPDQPNAIPVSWIVDGSWAELTSAAQSVCVVIRGLCSADGTWKYFMRETISGLTKYTVDTVSRASTELVRAGWIRRKHTFSRKDTKRRMFFALPEKGPRKVVE